MQTLEDLIYNRLKTDAGLSSVLASYNGTPAVFYQSAPDDTASGWNQRKQYPRIDYVVDLQSNPERKTNGVLSMNIWSTEDGTLPEEIEPIAKNLLCGVFLMPDNSHPFALDWARSDAIEKQDGDNIVIGISVSFDVYAFPEQITTDPDPIVAMNEFVRGIDVRVITIGRTDTHTVIVPSETNPVFYFRLESMQINRETNTVVWMDAVVAGHCFAGDAEIQWLRAVVDALALNGEVQMMDNSPMFIQNIKADSSFDALSSGQLRIHVRFGILRRKPYVHTLWNANREYQYPEGED